MLVIHLYLIFDYTFDVDSSTQSVVCHNLCLYDNVYKAKNLGRMRASRLLLIKLKNYKIQTLV